MKISKRAFLLVLAMCLISIIQVLAGSTGKISGQVTDKATGEVLPGVNVAVGGTSLGSATDVDGKFVILNVPPGRHTITASLVGYKRFQVQDLRVSVDFTTLDDTAAASFDYTATSGTLTFGNGETSKTFDIFIISDAFGEGDELLRFSLSNPTGGASLASADQSSLWILDDESRKAKMLLVTNTNDSGPGSLRQAILDANLNLEFLGREIHFSNDLHEPLDRCRTAQLNSRNIHRYFWQIDAAAEPVFQLACGGLHHPLTNF